MIIYGPRTPRGAWALGSGSLGAEVPGPGGHQILSEVGGSLALSATPGNRFVSFVSCVRACERATSHTVCHADFTENVRAPRFLSFIFWRGESYILS